MKKFTIKSLMFASVFFTTSLVAEDDLSKAFVCTPEEMVAFLAPIQEMQKIPVQTPTTKEVIAANIEASCAADPSSDECIEACFNMPNFAFPDLWKDLVDAYNTIVSSIPKISSAGSILDSMNDLYDRAKKEIMEFLNEDICKLVDLNDLKDTMGDYIAANVTKVVHDKYNFDLNNIDASSMNLLKTKLREKYGADSKYFFDPSLYTEDQKNEALNELKQEDRKFWDGL